MKRKHFYIWLVAAMLMGGALMSCGDDDNKTDDPNNQENPNNQQNPNNNQENNNNQEIRRPTVFSLVPFGGGIVLLVTGAWLSGTPSSETSTSLKILVFFN